VVQEPVHVLQVLRLAHVDLLLYPRVQVQRHLILPEQLIKDL
jgi:hypothetical protein